jgi:hypothetical protein
MNNGGSALLFQPVVGRVGRCSVRWLKKFLDHASVRFIVLCYPRVLVLITLRNVKHNHEDRRTAAIFGINERSWGILKKRDAHSETT